jgi:hypothetical protein
VDSTRSLVATAPSIQSASGTSTAGARRVGSIEYAAPFTPDQRIVLTRLDGSEALRGAWDSRAYNGCSGLKDERALTTAGLVLEVV